MLFPFQDVISIFAQEKTLFQDSVKNFNDLPLWNPYIFGGSPFLANPTSAMFYPSNWLFLLFPADSTFNIIFILDIILLGIFTYLFCRTIKLDSFSSFISAITITFSGHIVSLVFPGHIVNLDAFIWLPLILLFLEKVIQKQKIIYGIYAAIPIGLMLLAGASQIAVFSLLSVAIYFTLRAISNLPKSNRLPYLNRLSLIFFISIILGLMLAAVQIIPTHEFSKLSARANGLSYEFASDFSLHPKQAVSFIFPYFFGNPTNGTYWGKGNFWELNGYIGILPLLLASIGIVLKRTRLTVTFLALGLFALLFSFGKYSFVFPFFYKYIPQFDSFRVPSRFLYLYTFSFSVLAGIGVNILIEKGAGLKKYFSKLSLLILFSSVVGLIISLFFILNKNVHLYERNILNNSYAVGINHTNLFFQLSNDVIMFFFILILFSVALYLRSKNKLNISAFKSVITIIIIFDLWFFSSKFILTKNIQEATLNPEIIKSIKQDNSIYRIFDMSNQYLSTTEQNKIENVTGIHSLYLKDYRDFIWSVGKHEDKPYESFFQITKIENPIFLDLLNVKYIIEDNKLSSNQNFLPRAYIVPNAIVFPKDKILNKLKDPNFDPKNQIILQNKPDVSLINPSSFKEIERIYREPNIIKLKVNLTDPGFLVLSEIDYPGWEAFDNGHELKIFNTNYILRSVYLTKGSHEVHFIYKPESYNLGKNISIVALLACLAILFKNKAKFS